MFKLWATIQKDFRILLRDRVGLAVLFLMPILLATVITSVQNSTFELVNDNKIRMLIVDQDHHATSQALHRALAQIGMFDLIEDSLSVDAATVRLRMKEGNALTALVIPPGFSRQLSDRAQQIARQSLKGLSVNEDSVVPLPAAIDSLTFYYHPVMQLTFRKSIEGAVFNCLQLAQSKLIVEALYASLHQEKIPDSLEMQIVQNQVPLRDLPVSRDGRTRIPTASEHNIPAWTIFAMFFIVVSLAGSLVREKQSGSFLRLKTLPTGFYMALLSKEITYLVLTLTQAAVIFSIGRWVFPQIGLPALHLPPDLVGLVVITVVTGICAVSYGMLIGVLAQTQDQANSFGAVSVVILAALGGLLVPSFVMSPGLQSLLKISPLHWALEGYYGLFLEGGKLKDIWPNILSLLLIAALLQAVAIFGLKKKNLI